MNQRELLINIGLLAVIVVLAYFLLTLEPETHTVVFDQKQIEKIEDRIESGTPVANDETDYSADIPVRIAEIHGRFPDFFERPIFDPLVPTPTPTPIPTPSPTPPADLTQVVAQWQFQYGYDGKAGFMDQQNNQTFEMSIGDKRTVAWGRYSVDVELTAIDEDNFTATVSFEGQNYTFSFN